MRGPLITTWWGVVCSLLATSEGACQFPEGWSGKWFQLGVPHLITITPNRLETKGQCVESRQEKYIIEDKQDNCYRCLVIYQKHENVLQYKESYCDKRESLDKLCGLIPGDASLISMFRSDAGPIPCPFKGGPPFTFSYNKGSGQCDSPPSTVDSCTDESRLFLRYQACPDVHGTEETTEELVCLASWKDGSSKYLVGKLYHTAAHSDEERYRCFSYDYPNSGPKHMVVNVAQSGDATCNGLPSATEGSRTLKLIKTTDPSDRCRYPSWLTEHHHWHTLDHRHKYHFSMKNATLKITGVLSGQGSSGERNQLGAESTRVEMKGVCHSLLLDNDRQARLVVHLTTGCKSGYVCMMFYKRDGHVIELQRSHTETQIPEEACNSQHFNPATLPFTTLITATPRSRQCPHLGRYAVVGFEDRQPNSGSAGLVSAREGDAQTPLCTEQQQYHQLVVGCRADDTMEFHSACSAEAISTYSCHGSWEDNGTSYLIASPLSRKSVGARRFCFIYTGAGMRDSSEDRATLLQVSSVTGSCHRNITKMSSTWTLNLTSYGQCGDSGSKPNVTLSLITSLISVVLVLLVSSSSR